MKLLTTCLLLLSSIAFAHDDPPNGAITAAKATELAVHRIERLVTLKKIDPSFQNNVISLRAEESTENGATYKVYGTLAPGANGVSTQITLLQDAQGKTLSYALVPGPAPANPFVWPAADGLTLMEDALHFVLEGWVQHPEVKVYYNGLQSISLAPVKDSQGNLVAQCQVTSDDDNRVLVINLKADGTFLSYQVK